jgi:hypothetical protein
MNDNVKSGSDNPPTKSVEGKLHGIVDKIAEAIAESSAHGHAPGYAATDTFGAPFVDGMAPLEHVTPEPTDIEGESDKIGGARKSSRVGTSKG